MNHLNVQVFQCPWLACGVLEVSVCVIPSPQLADGYLRTAIIQQVFKQQ